MDASPLLKALLANPDEVGIFCDFDGSLSPIVMDPDDAQPVGGATSVLTDLARRFAVVAVVSGRPALDLAHRLTAPGVRLVGIHGMEEMADGSVWVLPAAEETRRAVERAAATLERELRDLQGTMIELKGLALAIHFRRATEEAERLAEPRIAAVAEAEGLTVVPGRKVLELRPPRGGDKGDAVRRLISEHRLRGALVAGDDVGDLPAFSAVSGLSPAVRVAVASEEAPPELLSQADLIVPSPQALIALFRRLARPWRARLLPRRNRL